MVALFLLVQLIGCNKADNLETQTTETIEETEETALEQSEAEETKKSVPSETQDVEESGLAENPVEPPEEPVDYSKISVEIGSYITFGHYEQDSVEADGTEPVEWLVLDMAGHDALLLSRYVLDVQTYGNSDFATINEWLNNNLLNAIFTEEEKRYTVSYTDVAEGTSWWSYSWAKYPESVHTDYANGVLGSTYHNYAY